MLVLKGTLLCLLGCLLVGLTTVTVEAAPKENTAGKCSDGKDNDGDKKIDCADEDCDSFCVPGGSETFDATATITQTFANDCVRTDTYNLSGCTPSDIQSECSVDSWDNIASTRSGECAAVDQNQDDDPRLSTSDVQTGLWREFFPQWEDILVPITEVTVFKFREFIVNGDYFASLGLHTDQYGNGQKPNNIWANVCASLNSPSLPLDPEEEAHLVCEIPLTANPTINLRKGGGTLALDTITLPRKLEVIFKRCPCI